jgi:hypothetical protein
MANLNTWLYEDHGCNRDYVNAPLKFENPKGFVDCWRTPKYYYYLWEAVYSPKPMVFIHPHFWRSQYVGQKKEIVVDSNCDEVELKVNGRSIGKLKPRFEEANVLRFKDVPIEPGVLTATAKKGDQVVAAKVVVAGPAARLALTANPGGLEASLDSLAIIRADIVDEQGNHVYGATNTLQWSVSGPGTLAGASVYSTDTDKCEATEGTMYIDAPTFNIIRSSGKVGEIKVRVRSPGLAPAEVTLTATTTTARPNLSISEPPLPESKRQAVARESNVSESTQASTEEIRRVSEDLVLKGASLDDYQAQIERFLRNNNSALDSNAPEFRAVASVFAQLLFNSHGSLVRDDFNFTIGTYNDCRRITRQIEPLKLPGLFKNSLREYYARAMIEQGRAKDYSTEAKWLASLPEGRVVVAGPTAEREPSVLYAQRPDLDVMVALAVPEFKTVPPDEKSVLLDALCVVNPNIKRRVIKSGGKKVDGVRQKVTTASTYEIAAGKPILVPSLKDLERLGRKERDQVSKAEKADADRNRSLAQAAQAGNAP